MDKNTLDILKKKNKYYKPPMTNAEKVAAIQKAKNKYCGLLTFGKGLASLRKDIQHYIDNYDYSHDATIALVLAIIDTCGFRVGNLRYKKKNNSTGITTLEKNQLSLGTSGSTIAFKGKKQVENVCKIVNPVINHILLDLVKHNNDNNFVFSYKGPDNQFYQITSSDINNFLDRYYLEKTNKNVSAKHFRTWKANSYFIDHLSTIAQIPNTVVEVKHNISMAIKQTATKLYHTPAICKRSYIDTRLVDLYNSSPNEFLDLYNSIATKKIDYIDNKEQKLLGMLEHLCVE